LPKQIQDEKNQAKWQTEDACQKKYALQEKALITRQNKEIRKIIDAVRERLQRERDWLNNAVVPEMQKERSARLSYPNSPGFRAADNAYSRLSFPISYLYPGYFIIVGFNME
jgi:hypothetical protein